MSEIKAGDRTAIIVHKDGTSLCDSGIEGCRHLVLHAEYTRKVYTVDRPVAGGTLLILEATNQYDECDGGYNYGANPQNKHNEYRIWKVVEDEEMDA